MIASQQDHHATIKSMPQWPEYLKPSDEGTHAVQNIPLWSENYLTQIYAPEAEIGFWFHLGRASFDPRLWNEIFIAYLPGDQYLVSSSFSYGDSATGPIGNQLHFHCDKPFRQWTKSFRGAASLVTGKQLSDGPFIPGHHVHVDAELVWNNLGPTFDLGKLSSNDTWSSAHYEEHGTVRGYLDFDGKRVELAGSGIRDHSWGPRDLSRFNYHTWMSGQFPGGRSFMVFDIVDTSGHAATYTLLGDQQGMREGKLISMSPHLATDPAQVDKSYEIVLHTPEGKQETIRGEILQVPTCSFAGASELLFGYHPTTTAHHLMFEAQTRFEWNGEVGYGLTDRTFNLKNKACA